MSAQPELEFTRCAKPEKLQELESLLESFAGWFKSSACAACIRLDTLDPEAGKRAVRKLAEFSTQIISGNDGYKHRKHATPAEIAEFTGRLRSQIRRSSERLARFEAA
jgi:hypothetical protein